MSKTDNEKIIVRSGFPQGRATPDRFWIKLQFGIMNEPHDVDVSQWVISAQAAVNAAAAALAAGGDVGDKFNVAKEKKAAGDEAFKNNDLATGAYPCVWLTACRVSLMTCAIVRAYIQRSDITMK